MQKHAALYCRLSVDDGSFGGSVSIETQKILLEQYCQAHSITEYEFYCDDGYSGTNFNRPAFQQLLSDIHAGKINLVIVKDLSRFGRNYVEVGLQVEHFKEQNVRFIAAEDHYDSTINEDDLMFPMRNVMNEMYARDVSKKTKAAKKAKAKAGQFMGSKPPFGYKLDPNDRHHLVIDEPAAEVVNYMLENKRCILIADDEPKMVRALRDFLRANGFYVLEAAGGEEALDVFCENSNVIDMILLDVMMPKLDGLETLKLIRESSSLVPVILLTAKGEEYDQLAGKFYADSDEVNVLLTLPIASIDNSISVFTESNIYISLAVLAIGIIIAMIVSKNISKPITDIEAVSKKIAALDFFYVADENCSAAELASLAKSINQMSGQLSFNMQQLTKANEQLQKDIEYRKQIEHYRREFIAGVSHEMKTPLALFQIYMENLKSNISGIDKDFYCDTIVEETKNLSRMVSDMLEISSVDSGFITLSSEDVDVAELCRNILREYQPVLGEYQTIADLPQNAVVSGDRKYLEQVIKNILNNAAEHTEIGNEITISLRCDKQVILEITNEGEHIPEEHLEHIWDAFYRTDKTRTRNENNNVGLGLYIVKTVIDKMGGSCKIRNTDNGVAVTLILNSR